MGSLAADSRVTGVDDAVVRQANEVDDTERPDQSVGVPIGVDPDGGAVEVIDCVGGGRM
ncbi:MAG: hypothetical protein WA964_08155 [Ilumatobacter sp.]|uniref:hypothetical protein n=1 Tax=Ilumatobacter sp. TaxID=1967498 RepID=UPI003C73080A